MIRAAFINHWNNTALSPHEKFVPPCKLFPSRHTPLNLSQKNILVGSCDGRSATKKENLREEVYQNHTTMRMIMVGDDSS